MDVVLKLLGPTIALLLIANTGAIGFAPPKSSSKKVEWYKVSYDKMENELVEQFAGDIARNERQVGTLAVLKIELPENFPKERYSILNNKISQALLGRNLKIKDCHDCGSWGVRSDKNGRILLEKRYQNSDELAQKSKKMGVDTYLTAKIHYRPTQMILHISAVNSGNSELIWKKMYSSHKKESDLNKSKSAYGRIDSSEHLSLLMAKETSLHLAVQMGVNFLPGVDKGQGASLHAMPGFDIYFGEKYNQSSRSFGFKLGGSFQLGKGTDDNDAPEDKSKGDPLPFAITFGPRFVYHLNPLTLGPRFSLISDAGLFLSSGMYTGYISFGPELTVVKRYAVSFAPLYIFESSVDSSETLNEQDNGLFESEGLNNQGRAGGLGYALRMTMNW